MEIDYAGVCRGRAVVDLAVQGGGEEGGELDGGDGGEEVGIGFVGGGGGGGKFGEGVQVDWHFLRGRLYRVCERVCVGWWVVGGG